MLVVQGLMDKEQIVDIENDRKELRKKYGELLKQNYELTALAQFVILRLQIWKNSITVVNVIPI